MADSVTASGNAGSRDTAGGFGATAETNDNTDQINDLLDQVRDLLAEDGLDFATAEALTNFARRSTPTITGNLADLQRMGAIAVTGEIPRNAMPSNQDQEAQETSNIEDAFAEPLPAETAVAGLQTPMGQIDGEGKPTGGTTSDGGDTATTAAADDADGNGDDLGSMTKAELQAEAEARGVEVSSSMTKSEIIAALEENR